MANKHIQRCFQNTKVRDFSQFSADRFNYDLSQVEWGSILSNATNDMDKMFSSFYSEFNKTVNKYAPMRKLSRRKAKQCSKPWITKGIRTSIKIKNKLYLSGNDAKYKFYRNKICSLTRISKKQYFCEYFQADINNMKKTWIGLSNILNPKTKKNKSISALKDFKNNRDL